MNVVSHKHLPWNPMKVVWLGVLLWLVLDRLDAGVAWYSGVFTGLGLFFILACVSAFTSKYCEPEWKK